MKKFLIEESGYYKVSKIISAKNEGKAIKEYEDWLNYKLYSGDIDLDRDDREVTKLSD